MMAELDFSALRNIQGFTPVETADNPFLQASTVPKEAYRAAYEYHKRHSPPEVDREYWRTHTAGADFPPPAEVAYWDQAAKDMASTASAHGGSQLLTDLLIAAYSELEREYKRLRASP